MQASQLFVNQVSAHDYMYLFGVQGSSKHKLPQAMFVEVATIFKQPAMDAGSL